MWLLLLLLLLSRKEQANKKSKKKKKEQQTESRASEFEKGVTAVHLACAHVMSARVRHERGGAGRGGAGHKWESFFLQPEYSSSRVIEYRYSWGVLVSGRVLVLSVSP